MAASQSPDEELLSRFVRSQDHDAFHQLVSRHSRLVFGVCHRILRHHQDSEDAFQATFLVLARDAEKIRCPRTLSSWLYGTAYRVALAALARKRRQEKSQLEEAVSTTESVFSQIARRRDQAIIDNALPCSYRDIVVLRCLDGKSTKEVAMQLQMTTGAVKGRLERAKHILRRRLLLRGVCFDGVSGALAAQQTNVTAMSPGLVRDTATAGCRFRRGEGMGGTSTDNALYLATHVTALTVTSTSLKVGAGIVTVAALVLVFLFQASRQLSAKESVIHVDKAVSTQRWPMQLAFATHLNSEEQTVHDASASAGEEKSLADQVIDGDYEEEMPAKIREKIDKHFIGTWNFSMSGAVKGTYTAKWVPGKHCVMVSQVAAGTGRSGKVHDTGLLAWQPDTKMVVHHVFRSNGDYFRILYDTFEGNGWTGRVAGFVNGGRLDNSVAVIIWKEDYFICQNTVFEFHAARRPYAP